MNVRLLFALILKMNFSMISKDYAYLKSLCGIFLYRNMNQIITSILGGYRGVKRKI